MSSARGDGGELGEPEEPPTWGRLVSTSFRVRNVCLSEDTVRIHRDFGSHNASTRLAPLAARKALRPGRLTQLAPSRLAAEHGPEQEVRLEDLRPPRERVSLPHRAPQGGPRLRRAAGGSGVRRAPPSLSCSAVTRPRCLRLRRSSNGTLLNDKRLVPNEPMTLRHNDVINMAFHGPHRRGPLAAPAAAVPVPAASLTRGPQPAFHSPSSSWLRSKSASIA